MYPTFWMLRNFFCKQTAALHFRPFRPKRKHAHLPPKTQDPGRVLPIETSKVKRCHDILLGVPVYEASGNEDNDAAAASSNSLWRYVHSVEICVFFRHSDIFVKSIFSETRLSRANYLGLKIIKIRSQRLKNCKNGDFCPFLISKIAFT